MRSLPITILVLLAGACGSRDARTNSLGFRDVTPELHVAYKRTPSATHNPVAPMMKEQGAPGIALIDVDRDDDLDIYVSNGPNTDNSLFINERAAGGSIRLVDRGEQAGVGARAQDSTGVCFGDLDNDGDDDLIVLGNRQPTKLFANRGDGTFTDVSDDSGLGARASSAVACSVGDVDGDGLLDLAVANTFDMRSIDAIGVEAFSLSEPNDLYRNLGGLKFEDISDSSGIRELDFPTDAAIKAPSDAGTISWAIALVDIDADGDVDLVHADDQGAVDNSAEGGINRGMIHLLINDGKGHFADQTLERGLNKEGGWMGLAFADFDRDGRLDVFGTNFGNHAAASFNMGVMPAHEENDSRWFLQQADGTFLDSLDMIGRQNTPFGWGVSAIDYDNDGDSDVLYRGGIDLWAFVQTTPEVLLENDGRGAFTRNRSAFPNAHAQLLRSVNGVASGDLDLDGFVDVVSVSAFDLPPSAPLRASPKLGGDFDDDALFALADNALYQSLLPGSLSVQLSNGLSARRSISVKLLGTVGIQAGGRSNRDGIGALIRVTPEGATQHDERPVLGGASYASQGSLVELFGLGSADRATVEVIWPGGTRNRITGVPANERLLFPEIPCSLDRSWSDAAELSTCLDAALSGMRERSVLDTPSAERFRSSMLEAFASGS